MKVPLLHFDRISGEKREEKVYGDLPLRMLYHHSFLSKLAASFVSRTSLVSYLYGLVQRLPTSRRKIIPFIKKFGIDTSEFAEPPSTYKSFNDFFIRKLKPEARPIAPGEEVAIIPTDGRFLFYQNIKLADGFHVKSKEFCLTSLLQNESLAKNYAEGSIVLGRLCPTDYHRFHFPCAATPSDPLLINGHLYSVNPLALRKNIAILAENKRIMTLLDTPHFGKVLFLEIGATNVGSIHETFTPGKRYEKGEEKGFFSFGGSALILLFEKDRITFDDDLIQASLQRIETRCLLGQSMGRTASKNV